MKDAQLGVILAFVFGVVFVTALLALVVFIPNPTPSQFEIIRIVLALAAGGVAAMIPGFLNLKLGIGSNLALRAGGALAVFAVVYFYSPAHWVSSPTSSDSNINQKTEGLNSPATVGNGNTFTFGTPGAAVDKSP